MESLAFPGGKRVGIRPSRNPVTAMYQGANLALLHNAAAFMRASHRLCRVADEHRKAVKEFTSKLDRQRYLNKCYPRRIAVRSGTRLLICERLSNGNVVVAREV